jgi:adenosylmethionine-8-amino-7-oxononanoate aminotransferase
LPSSLAGSEAPGTLMSEPARWDPDTYPLWHGSVPMHFLLDHASPGDMWVEGDGVWLIDASGRRYLDGRSGIGNVMLGYSRSDIVDRMHHQAMQLPFVSTMRYERVTPIVIDYARALVDAAPDGLTRVRFMHTGSSAVESALLMARSYHKNLGHKGKTLSVGLRGSYHGSTMMAMAASGQPTLHWYFGPMPEGFVHLPGPTPDTCSICTGDASLDATCGDDLVSALHGLDMDRISAVIVEPVNGRSGLPLPTHYLQALRAVCTQYDIVLIFDEVFAGFGRMGALFAAELSGVTPDLLCAAKGITSGYAALGAVLAADHVYDAFNTSPTSYFAHASSTDAHPVACAAGLATLEAFQRENVVANGVAMGQRLRDALVNLLSSSGRLHDVRSTGAFIALDLLGSDGRPASMMMKRYLEAACASSGVLIDYTPFSIMLAPPLVISAEEVDLLAETLADVVLRFEDDAVDPSALRPPALRGHR